MGASTTHGIEERASHAEGLWSQGDAAFAAGDHKLAYQRYTSAHDLVTDCPALHECAHRKLKTVTKLHGERGEHLTDSVLLGLAPLGIFRLIAFALRSRVAGSGLCRTRA